MSSDAPEASVLLPSGRAAWPLVVAALAGAVGGAALTAALLAPRESGPPDSSPVLARVDGETLTADQFRIRWNEVLSPEARRFHARRGGPRSYLDEVVEELLLTREAERRGLDGTASVREAVRVERNHAVTRPLLREDVQRAAIPESELRAYFQAHRGEWSTPLRVEASEILVRAEPGREDEARAEAEDLRRRAQAGEDFETLARESSDAPTAAYGGRIGWVVPGQFARTYEEAALALKPGELSPVVATADGFVVLRASAREEPHVPTFEDEADEIRERLLAEDQGALHRRYSLVVEELRGEADVEVHDDVLDALVGGGTLRP